MPSALTCQLSARPGSSLVASLLGRSSVSKTSSWAKIEALSLVAIGSSETRSCVCASLNTPLARAGDGATAARERAWRARARRPIPWSETWSCRSPDLGRCPAASCILPWAGLVSPMKHSARSSTGWNRRDETHALRVIDAFVRLGGTGEAAQGLGVSQSAVIKALRLAEQELDLSLVATVQGRLTPTPEARTDAAGAAGLRVLRRARHEADMIRVGMADRLRIATVPGLAHSILPLPSPAHGLPWPTARPSRSSSTMSAIISAPARSISRSPMAPWRWRPARHRAAAQPAGLRARPGASASRPRRLTLPISIRQRLISYGPDGVSRPDSFQKRSAEPALQTGSRSPFATPTLPAIWRAKASASPSSMASSSAAA